MVKRETIRILKKYIELLRNEGIFVHKAFLYGSYLDGNESEDSDIDLLIVADNDVEENDPLSGRIWNLTKKINSKIEPYLIGINRFSAPSSSPLIEEIKKRGLEIS
ncbi:MAG: nucleotidyltransferase domain-containing protein [Anditalea sp.]